MLVLVQVDAIGDIGVVLRVRRPAIHVTELAVVGHKAVALAVVLARQRDVAHHKAVAAVHVCYALQGGGLGVREE